MSYTPYMLVVQEDHPGLRTLERPLLPAHDDARQTVVWVEITRTSSHQTWAAGSTKSAAGCCLACSGLRATLLAAIIPI